MVNFTFFPIIHTVEDKEIKQVVEYAYDLSLNYTEEIKRIFEKENFPILQGFTDEDLHRNTPRLFTDLFMINFIKSMAKVDLSTYAISRSLSSKIYELFLKHVLKLPRNWMTKQSRLC
ncbi:DUF3231 family protein [Neobacillus sp. BF23-41]|uniref:DUF3231 family protein n=1 Tax=Neobacillus sp. BF23-41 TaxID=3240280 RepID=UPI0034E56DF4